MQHGVRQRLVAKDREEAEKAPSSVEFAKAVQEAGQLNVDQQQTVLSKAQLLLAYVPMVDHLEDIIDMLHLQLKRRYTIEWTTRVAFLAAVVYLVSPIDTIPDTIPVVGYLDDAAVLRWTTKQHLAELERFRQWKANHPRSVCGRKRCWLPL